MAYTGYKRQMMYPAYDPRKRVRAFPSYAKKRFVRSYEGASDYSRSTGGVRRTRTARKSLKNARTGGYLGLEYKFYDLSNNGTAMVASATCAGGELDPATVNTLTAPAQDTGPSDREGARIIVRECHIDGFIATAVQSDQTAGDAACNYVVYLVQDKQSNGAQLNSEDVFVNPSGQSALGASPMRNLENSSRFVVLGKVCGAIQPPVLTYDGTNLEGNAAMTPFRIDWVGEMPVKFESSAATGGISAVKDNSLHVVGFVSNTAMTPTIYYNARVRFNG